MSSAHGHDSGAFSGHAGGQASGRTHGHGHGHAALSDHRGKLAAVLAITVTVLVVEVIGAVLSGSLALLADAAHMLTDVAGLTLGLIAAALARRPATPARTWGYHRAEILGAAAQAALLLAVGAFVLYEGVRRLFEPPEVASALMVLFGVIGLVGNAIGLLILAGARSSNLNLRAAFLEVLNDALGSVAVILAAAAIALFGWYRADAIASIVIGALIIPRTIRLLRETTDVLLESTPKGVDLQQVREHLLALDHVHGVHDLHASQIATGIPVLTAHLVVDESCFQDGHLASMLDHVQACINTDFGITHSTIQFESVAHAAHEPETHD